MYPKTNNHAVRNRVDLSHRWITSAWWCSGQGVGLVINGSSTKAH